MCIIILCITKIKDPSLYFNRFNQIQNYVHVARSLIPQWNQSRALIHQLIYFHWFRFRELVLVVYFYEFIVYMLFERNAFDSIAFFSQCRICYWSDTRQSWHLLDDWKCFPKVCKLALERSWTWKKQLQIGLDVICERMTRQWNVKCDSLL